MWRNLSLVLTHGYLFIDWRVWALYILSNNSLHWFTNSFDCFNRFHISTKYILYFKVKLDEYLSENSVIHWYDFKDGNFE